ncbi:putative AT-hook motif nuclear-localized protein 15-29 [Helianthus annuus]|nr:putative AT-hook motif nuclear-localized protein 15-29 [Helianthus annuus]
MFRSYITDPPPINPHLPPNSNLTMADYDDHHQSTPTYLHRLLDLPLLDSLAGATGSRSPGSKNKPKPLVIITRETPNYLRSNVLEISLGDDVIDTLNVYAHRRGRGVSVLSGTCVVIDVTLRRRVLVACRCC